MYRKLLVFIAMWFATAQITQVWADAKSGKFVLVIDAGHGGHDPGAIGQYAKEKDINLNVALAFGRLVEQNCADVKVIYTRKTDVFIPLDTRAEIANRAKADLFVSVHTNSLPKGSAPARGAETYTLGMARAAENLAVAKRENAVILEETNYKEKYAGFNPNSSESYIIFEFMQDKNMEQSVELAKLVQQEMRTSAHRIDKGVHQAGFLVLRKTSMPSVLIELGYISTSDEESFLNSGVGVNSLGQGIYQAFVKYKNKRTGAKRSTASTGTVASTTPAAKPEEPAKKEEVAKKEEPVKKEEPTPAPATTPQKENTAVTSTTASSKPVFKVQILTSPKELPANSSEFKGLSPVSYYRDGRSYKYTYGESEDYNKILQLRRDISSKFNGCFVVAFINGERTDLNAAIQTFRKNDKK